LHDMGLTETHRPRAAECCFALNGGLIAYDLARAHGWDESKSQHLHDTIGLHINPLVSVADHGPEAKLLGNGAFMDIVGLRHYCVPTQDLQEVILRYPRGDFIEEILRVMREMDHRPDSRSGFMSKLGIDFLARRNPLNSP